MSSIQDDVLCFMCAGAGEFMALVRYETGECEQRLLRCQDCDGTGRVSAVRAAAHAEGRRRRDLRVAARMSQSEMAAQLGVTPQAYSQMELGRLPFPEGSETLYTSLVLYGGTGHQGIYPRGIPRRH